jgi:C-terminal processing protease CtpA/Prc
VEAMAALHPRTRDPWQLIDQGERAWKEHRPVYKEYGKAAIIMRLPDFVFDPDRSDEMLNKIRSYDVLILDLRGNPGGYVTFLSRFLGGMFDHEIKIAEPVGRKSTSPTLTKSRGGKTFRGKLIVLIDSNSASAAELFARVVQLEKRGVVVGDRSAWMVMEARIHPHEVLVMHGAFNFAVSVTEADMIMADGKSLEKIGVVPDEKVVPTPMDLASGRDPALARAAALAGLDLTPEAAGKLFPVEWPTD